MFTCPRRSESPYKLQEESDVWSDKDHTCSYCGSMNPDDLFEAIAKEESIGPTDKNYKIYVGERKKFYFQHLDKEQQLKFIELYNDKKMKLDYPGHFYVYPFFMQRVSK